MPASQKHRQIGFFLWGAGIPAVYIFHLRPEQLTRSEPSRLTVNQTLGGAWADSFGRGVSTINLSGHTGWRGGIFGDGASAFYDLRDSCFVQWHAQREAAAASGTDPDTIQLYFVDTLDDICALVAPKSFTLQRSKSSPLLYRYQIQLVILDDASAASPVVDLIAGNLSGTLRWLGAVSGLGNIIGIIGAIADNAANIFGMVADSVAAYLNTFAGVLSMVSNLASTGQGIFNAATQPILGAALAMAEAGRNGFQLLATAETLASRQAQIMRASAACNDALCSMAHGFAGKTYPSFEDLFGASTCSSTAGGRPWSTYTEQRQNPFFAMYPPVASRLLITPAGRDAITLLRRDPLGGTAAGVADMLGAIADGVLVQ